jgi:hypothetical protein
MLRKETKRENGKGGSERQRDRKRAAPIMIELTEQNLPGFFVFGRFGFPEHT